jgi:glycosyltransferase involved in cell wall biosynthesis
MERSKLMERLEKRVWRSFDVVLYPSAEEANEVRSLSPRTLAVPIVPFRVDPLSSRPVPPGNKTVLFVAGFAHPPNVDAAKYLVREILPRLKPEGDRIKVILAGSNPTEEVEALASDQVVVTGHVHEDELDRLYLTSRVAIVPLRFGAGVKGKVVEALGRGVPLITTSVGAQGIPGLGDVAAVYDEVDDIARALMKLLEDDAAWLEQSKRQLQFAGQRFSRTAMRESILSALEAGESALRGSELVSIGSSTAASPLVVRS